MRTLSLGVLSIYVLVEKLLGKKTSNARYALERVAGMISFDVTPKFRLGHKTLATSVASKLKQDGLHLIGSVDWRCLALTAQFLL